MFEFHKTRKIKYIQINIALVIRDHGNLHFTTEDILH